MSSIQVPTTQSALQWVKVSTTDPFQWSTSAPVIQPSDLPDGKILVENHAVTLNPLDFKMPGYNFAQVTLPACTGYDLSGRVVGVGKGVTAFKVGDEVFGCVEINTSHGGGSLQQYTVTATDGLVKKPANVSHADAATLGVAYLSAMVRQLFFS